MTRRIKLLVPMEATSTTLATYVPRLIVMACVCGGLLPRCANCEEEPPARQAVPNEETLAKATVLVRRIFSDEYADHSPGSKKRLAERLKQQAEKSREDPIARYAMLRESRDNFARDGAAREAVRIAESMEKDFVIRGAAAEIEAVMASHAAVKSPQSSVEIVNVAIGAAESALREDNADGAARVIHEVEASPLRKGSALAARLQAAVRRVHAARQSAEALTAAQRKLRVDPTDRVANFTIGKAFCFEQDRWDLGLPLLERGRSLCCRDPAAGAARFNRPRTGSGGRLVEPFREIRHQQSPVAATRCVLVFQGRRRCHRLATRPGAAAPRASADGGNAADHRSIGARGSF